MKKITLKREKDKFEEIIKEVDSSFGEKIKKDDLIRNHYIRLSVSCDNEELDFVFRASKYEDFEFDEENMHYINKKKTV